MSDHASPAEHESHEGPIKTPQQLIGAVVASFVVPVVVIIMLANFVDFGGKPGAGSDGLGEEAVARRLCSRSAASRSRTPTTRRR